MRRSVLPLAALLLAAAAGAGCVFFIDDPEGWTVGQAGAAGSAGASGKAGGAGSAGAAGKPAVRCTGDALGCSCQPGAGGSKACGPAGFDGDVLCCADALYPSKGSCSCRVLSCDYRFDDSCSCSLGENIGAYSSCEGGVINGEVYSCCQTGSTCFCGKIGDVDCNSDVYVGSCTTSKLECEEGGSRVSSCSP